MRASSHLRFHRYPTGASLPLREMRKCVPEFLALNMIFLYLMGYNTEYCAIAIFAFYSTHLRKSVHGRIVFSLFVLSCKTDISACNCITGNPNTAGKRN